MRHHVDKVAYNQDLRSEMVYRVECLQLRLGLLEPDDRVLLEMHLNHQVRFRQLEILTGIPARTLARRAKGLADRLVGEKYISFIRQRERFSEDELQVAYDHYLLGLGYRQIAAKRRIATSQVRLILTRLGTHLKRLRSIGDEQSVARSETSVFSKHQTEL